MRLHYFERREIVQSLRWMGKFSFLLHLARSVLFLCVWDTRRGRILWRTYQETRVSRAKMTSTKAPLTVSGFWDHFWKNKSYIIFARATKIETKQNGQLLAFNLSFLHDFNCWILTLKNRFKDFLLLISCIVFSCSENLWLMFILIFSRFLHNSSL